MAAKYEAKTVLEKAVQKAVANGWNVFGFKGKEGFKWWVGSRTGYKEAPVLFISTKEFGVWDYRPVEVVYNHDFAKALWGTEWPLNKHGYGVIPSQNLWSYDGGYEAEFGGEPWEFHLQQMVISKSVWEYLEKTHK